MRHGRERLCNNDWQGKTEGLVVKPAPAPLCPEHTPHGCGDLKLMCGDKLANCKMNNSDTLQTKAFNTDQAVRLTTQVLYSKYLGCKLITCTLAVMRSVVW